MLEAPIPERRQLANGLMILVVPKHDLPLVSVSILVRAGSALDGKGKDGLAGFVGDLLRSGTKTRSAQAIADEVETEGAHLEANVEQDELSVSSSALTTHWLAVFDVMADVVTSSTFAPEEVERVRQRRLAALAEEADDPERTVTRIMYETVFGTHPYGHTVLGDAGAVGRISRKDIVAFAEAHLRPDNAAVVVVGDVTVEQAFAEVQRRLDGWRGVGSSEPRQIAAPTTKIAQIILVPRAGAPQSQVLVGELGIPRNSPDFYATLIMNEILGGMFNSRLNMNLREDKGYTYGAYSYFDAKRYGGAFVAGAGIRTDATVASVKEIFAEIEGIRQHDVGDDELTHAEQGFALSLPARFQTIGSIATMVGNIYLYDFALDYYRTLPKKILAVTRDEVRNAAVNHIVPNQLSIVVVGDREQVEPGLRALNRGPVVVRAIEAAADAGTGSSSGSNSGPSANPTPKH